MVDIYYLLLFFKNVNLKHTAISQRSSFNSVSLAYIFLFFHKFLSYLCKLSYRKKLHYIVHFEFLLFNVLRSVWNICWRMFLSGLFVLQFPTNYIKEPVSLQSCLRVFECYPKPNQTNVKYSFLNKGFCSKPI